MESFLESVNSWGQTFASSTDFGSLVSKFVWIDWVVLFFVVIGIIYGLRKGMMRMLAEILEMVIVIFITVEIYPKVAHYLQSINDALTSKISVPIAFVVTLSLIWVFVMIIDGYAKKLMHTDLIKPLKYLGGAFMGTVSSLLFVSVFVYFVNLMPFYSFKKAFEPGYSFTGAKLLKVVPTIHLAMSDPSRFIKVDTAA